MSILLDPISILVVICPVAFAALILGQGSLHKMSVLCRDLGIPVGILFALIGMVQIMFGVDHGEVVYSATSIMLVAVFHGAWVSALGFFGARYWVVASGEPLSVKGFSWRAAGAVIFLMLTIGFSIARSPIGHFLNPMAITVVLVLLGASLFTELRRSGPGGSASSRALLFAAIISVLLGLVTLYSGDGAAGMSIAANGLIYGLLGYLIIYLLGFHNEPREEINASLTNWHWMEVTGFYIFMFLAPDTILDNFQEADVAARFELLEQKVEDLERELNLLRLQ